MLNSIRARAGQIIGRSHMTRQANCQDSYALAQTESAVIGVVCDGCGEGHHSEVGSTLAAKYIIAQCLQLIDEKCDLAEIPAVLYPRIVDYLEDLIKVSMPINRLQFVQHHLLFTIVGVILTQEGGIIFSSGDGLIAVDDTVNSINQNNKPAYIAYHLIRENVISTSVIQHDFTTQIVDDWQRIVIATDGFETQLLPELRALQHPRSLQRKLNVWSNQQRRFQDDATLIVLDKVESRDNESTD
ncbi:MAG: protein phosphatase 2C domain-containing protein [Anaerolineae bacterium]|nr:protein phosphatase 2C domain-containing protein [Anaerolineae bacterium]MDQ7037494.1 protein phosphatase 2C domain-containing protein [Anaerolineae bacterium]